MQKLAVLGPKGTYSDIAARKYLETNNMKAEIEYYPSILKTSLALKETDLAILPFENTLDGFVLESMDTIITNEFKIIDQIKLDIDFVFVTNEDKVEDCKDVYCQFKAYGQCVEFISKYDFNIIQTQSNSATVKKINEAGKGYGAIIPIHALKDNDYKTKVLHVADRRHNQTRFFICSKEFRDVKYNDEIDASIVIVIKEDRPGILFEILKELSVLNINMNSIMSRPMKTDLGQYKFYIEISLMKDSLKKLDRLKDELKKKGFIIEILGIYNKI